MKILFKGLRQGAITIKSCGTKRTLQTKISIM